MSSIIAAASGIWQLVIADILFDVLIKKTTEAGINDAAKWIADLRKDKAKQKRFAALMQKAWQDLEPQHPQAADAIRKTLLNRKDGRQAFGLECLKLLLFAEKPNLDALQRSYTFAKNLMADASLPDWPQIVEPIDAYLGFLQQHLLDTPEFRPAAIEKETLGILREIIAQLQGPLYVEIALPTFTEAQLAAARDDYLAMLRQEHQYLDLAGLAPKVQNRTVKIKLEDVFIPLKARPELSSRQPLTRQMIRFMMGNMPDNMSQADIQAKLQGDWRELLNYATNLAQIRAQLAGLGYVVPEHMREALKEGESIDISGLLAMKQAVILGDPGSGKSTLLKYLTWAIAAQKGDLIGQDVLAQVPIPIKIIHWIKASANSESLKSYLCRADKPERCALFDRAIERGEALILLDALDEVPDTYSRGRAAEGIRRFVADYPGNRVLVTSRIVGYDPAKLAGHFEHVTLEKLPKEEIARFVGNWYAAIEREAEGTDEVIQAAYQRAEGLQQAIESTPGVQALAENPLLLTIVALVNWRGRRLPDRRVELYQHAAETLIESWPFTQRGIKLDTRIVMGILEPVAYRLFAERGSQELDENTLRPIMVEAIEEKRGCRTADAEEYAQELLSQITEQSGIFVERGIDPAGRRYFGFLHQTFAEYFAARHLANRWKTGSLDLLPYARNPRWHEALLLMAGHLGLSDDQTPTKLVAELLDLPDAYPQLERNLILVARCLADNTPVQAQAAHYVVKKIAALACARPRALQNAIKSLLPQLGKTAFAMALVTHLLDFSRDENEGVRESAAYALGDLVDADLDADTRRRIFDCLLDLSRDVNEWVQKSAADVLGSLDSADPDADIYRLIANHMLDFSHDVNEWVRGIAYALGNLGRADPDANTHHLTADRLLALIRGMNERAQGIADALDNLGRADPDADTRHLTADRLLDLICDENEEVRESAIYALGRLDSADLGGADTRRRIADRLLDLSRDENEGVRISAAYALGNLGRADLDADARRHIADRLLDLSRDENERVRWRANLRYLACRAAERQRDESSLADIIQWLDDDGLATIERYVRVADIAYQTASTILEHLSPEPPVSFEALPKPVAGPWDNP